MILLTCLASFGDCVLVSHFTVTVSPSTVIVTSSGFAPQMITITEKGCLIARSHVIIDIGARDWTTRLVQGMSTLMLLVTEVTPGDIQAVFSARSYSTSTTILSSGSSALRTKARAIPRWISSAEA